MFKNLTEKKINLTAFVDDVINCFLSYFVFRIYIDLSGYVSLGQSLEGMSSPC